MNIVYGAVGAVILALCVLVGIERVQISDRNATIAQMKAANERSTADFQSAARAREQEYEIRMQKLQTDFAAMQSDNAKHVADLSSRNKLLNSAIDAFASRDNQPVPDKTGASCSTDGQKLLGQFLEQCNGLLIQGIGAVQGARNQIDALAQACR